jgi:predicted site-specific integrase-resolvase
MKVSISRAAKELGVSITTLRRWEKAGKIVPERTANGHRRYDLSQLTGIVPRLKRSEKVTICYARVSSHDQKQDLN